jgi:hypothetical protein
MLPEKTTCYETSDNVRAAWRRNDLYEVRDSEVSHPVYDRKSVNDPASTKNSCWKDKKRRPEEESRSTWDDAKIDR